MLAVHPIEELDLIQDHDGIINLLLPGEVALHGSMKKPKVRAMILLLSAVFIAGSFGLLAYLLAQ